MTQQNTDTSAAGVYNTLSAFADRLERRMEQEALSLKDDDVNKVMAEHVRHALEELECHADLDAMAAKEIPDLNKLRAARIALDRLDRAKIELTDLLEVMDCSLYGNRPEDLTPLFYRVSRRDLDEVAALVNAFDNASAKGWNNLLRQEDTFRASVQEQPAARPRLHLVKPDDAPNIP